MSFTPMQKARRLTALRDISSGRVHIPYRCGHCIDCVNLYEDSETGEATCTACGHKTAPATLRARRIRDIVAYVERASG